LYTAILFLLSTIAAGGLYLYKNKHLERNLDKILHFDYRGYDPSLCELEQYFLPDGNRPDGNNNIVDKVERTEMKEKPGAGGETHIQDNQDGVLRLRDNNLTTDRCELQVNNYTTNENNIKKPDTNTQGKKPITLADYGALSSVDLLKVDKRTTLVYLRDLLLLEHSAVSLVFKRSFKDPFFLRLYKFVFSVSMLFAMNALTYTDSYIDQQHTNPEQVISFNPSPAY
jgi:hypothetical protein